MKNKLRLLVIAACALLLILLGVEYKSVPINDRAFVLGIGIDYADNMYELTAEILVPSKIAGAGAGENSHKVLSGHGIDIAHALNDIFNKTGKLPSLGHCSVLILGEGVYKKDTLKELEFFSKSDSFRASTAVAVAEGRAKDLMTTKTPLEQFTALSLFDIMSVYGKSTNTSVTTLGEFGSKILSMSASAYLTVIKPVPSPEAEASEGGDSGAANDSNEPPVFYDCSTVAAFKDRNFVGFLSNEESEGLRLLQDKNSYDSFRVKNDKGTFVTVNLTSKSVKTCVDLNAAPRVALEVTVKIKSAEAEDLNTAEGFVVSPDITDDMRNQVKTQITQKVHAACQRSVALQSDFMYLSNKFFARLGKRWEEYARQNPNFLAKTQFEISVQVD